MKARLLLITSLIFVPLAFGAFFFLKKEESLMIKSDCHVYDEEGQLIKVLGMGAYLCFPKGRYLISGDYTKTKIFDRKLRCSVDIPVVAHHDLSFNHDQTKIYFPVRKILNIENERKYTDDIYELDLKTFKERKLFNTLRVGKYIVNSFPWLDFKSFRFRNIIGDNLPYLIGINSIQYVENIQFPENNGSLKRGLLFNLKSSDHTLYYDLELDSFFHILSPNEYLGSRGEDIHHTRLSNGKIISFLLNDCKLKGRNFKTGSCAVVFDLQKKKILWAYGYEKNHNFYSKASGAFNLTEDGRYTLWESERHNFIIIDKSGNRKDYPLNRTAYRARLLEEEEKLWLKEDFSLYSKKCPFSNH